MNINESVISITSPKVGMVSLLYDSATEQQAVFAQNFTLYYMSTYYWNVDMKNGFDESPTFLMT